MVADANGVGYVEHCPEVGHITDHAVYRAAVELNRSGLQHTVANGSALLLSNKSVD